MHVDCRRTLVCLYWLLLAVVVYEIYGRSFIIMPLGIRPESIAQLINESDKRNNIEIETHSHTNENLGE